MKNLLSIFILLFALNYACTQKTGDARKGENLIDLDFQFSEASVKTKGNKLIANTGKVERIWEATNSGLRTISLKNGENDLEYSNPKSDVLCDWSYNGLINNSSKAKLINLTATKSNDEGFTSDHIEVVAEFEYPEIETFIKYTIWVYPDAPGIRTQLFIKGNGSQHIDESLLPKRKDVQFDLVKGNFKGIYQAKAFADESFSKFTEDEQQVEYHIDGLNRSKNYKLGFTWWDFQGLGISQNVWVTSVDGETKHQLIKNKAVPNFKIDKATYEMNLLDLPSDILLDGSFRLIFERTRGAKAMVSEIFIYEENRANLEMDYGNKERSNQLKQLAPPQTGLIGYLDCGSPITGEKLIPTGRVDYIPVQTQGANLKFIGYYNDTQHRNKRETPLLKETGKFETTESLQNNWSNIVVLEKDNSGIIVVKESHKCANQYGVDTGEFGISENGIENTGTSIFPDEIIKDRHAWCWASWSILFEGGQDEMELAIKEFDRFRYPIDDSRDIYLQANTWGTRRSRNASKEEDVLLELESQQDLGIDIQQIDDGWQAACMAASELKKIKERDANYKDWHVRKDWYPDGWKNVVSKSEETGVKLGLWGAASPITLEELKWNYDQAGFVTYKLDFANLSTHQQMDNLITKVRDFIQYTDHKIRVNWDVTENAPRYGYYWAKEYGSVFLENRTNNGHVVYTPYLVLRDIWHLSKYTNVNRFQTSIQNIEMVDKKHSDAYQHNHPYAVAIGLIGTPLFFQETQNYDELARSQIKPLLALYKSHRNELYKRFVFPIGDEPNNANWSGFQWHKSQSNIGYLMIFRELNNKEATKEMKLRFLENIKIKVTDLQSGETVVKTVDENGTAIFEIAQATGFKFLKYEVID